MDSVEHDNRALADTILELADLCLFVTTATRYADRVPWDVLARAARRRVPSWWSSTGSGRGTPPRWWGTSGGCWGTRPWRG